MPKITGITFMVSGVILLRSYMFARVTRGELNSQ